MINVISQQVMPFFLTGLFDDDYSTRVLVFALIEMVGEKYEKLNEVDLREKRQLGLDAAWTYDGRACDIPFLPLIHGVHHELAARAAVFDVKDYDWPLMAELVTTGAKASTWGEMLGEDISEEVHPCDPQSSNALNAARLLAVLVGFVEEGELQLV
ncbi:hypothetical protein Pmar_PMAR020627 [Perkinsus marinus ATCC 50983]|uniref:Uncharacterized protein n=1 Tax=Perkinsus marinus (strain ATCC 50983 / TXsc) TaxID=423536 RepID=C5L7K2_PERM5|nr:hypothetical protein Pmar_PMAR020627 [Perkinsus marinus ATCC 50983]EER07464.1 hypothetical protein Pmar_PMAR020627 [Perkinsus marinus ATCC 50983]|eukprot:XP_002775648.1 hypothetical protein Pmar_PMAR020627 [Perkinsus marinus ATCC 50983]